MTTLLIAANRRQKEHECKQVLIGIKRTGDKFYIEKEEVLKLMERTANGSLLQKSVATIDLAKLEKALKTNPWIKNAQLYFDNREALHVFVEEREPIARVFTTAGNSFYIDSSGNKMPLLDKMSVRVPVVTGFTNDKKFNATDSDLLIEVKQVASFIYTNEFWNAQIGQIDITPEKKFELIPVVGDHIIKLGDAENIDEKLNRLYIFYKQVLSKVGFNKYAALDVEYDGQVVAVKKGITSAVDSIQLKKNIEELMNKASLQSIDEQMLPAQNIAVAKKDSAISNTAVQTNSVSKKTNPNPVVLKQTQSNTAKKKTKTQFKHVEKLKQEIKANDVKKPKAVMKKQGQ